MASLANLAISPAAALFLRNPSLGQSARAGTRNFASLQYSNHSVTPAFEDEDDDEFEDDSNVLKSLSGYHQLQCENRSWCELVRRRSKCKWKSDWSKP
jgi:hypothetical protein